MILLLSFGYLSAQDRQFYFIGKYDRLGSQSSDAANKKGVYLRWDMIESDIPSEIVTLDLVRIVDNNSTTLLSNVPAHGTMKSADIQNLFMEYGSERRLFEAIDFISNNTNPNCTGANISNIGSKVAQCLNDNYWAFLASRANFDIARARYRAYLDTGVNETMGNVTYELRGTNAAGTQSMILGKTKVELKSSRVLPAVDFEQILASHCNDGNYALDDYRVALKWKNGGNKTNFFANGLMVSGYDIYYSTKPVSMLSEQFLKTDIAKLVAKLPHNTKGVVDLSNYDLKKANNTLITVGGQAGEENKPNYLESQADLKARGFKPGEKRYYFLVPKDFTGNYGPSISMEVQIPDMLPPATPINPRAVENAGQFALMWENMTLNNYAAHYEDSMKLCSTTTNTQETRHQFVDLNESCQEGNGIMINLNVAKYYVYRFDNHAEAAAFTDNDLDGYADQDEKEKEQCNKNLPLPKSGRLNYLVATIDNAHEDTVVFTDKNVKQGKVYWYRIVSVTPSDVASPLSAPVRAFMPKREVLPVPEITVLNQTEFYVEINAIDNVDLEIVAQDLTGMDFVDVVKLDINGGEYILDKQGSQFILTQEIKNVVLSGNDTSVTFSFYSGSNLIKAYSLKVNEVFRTHTLKLDTYIDGVHHSVDLKSREILHVNGRTSSNPVLTLKFSDEYYDFLKLNGACMKISARMGIGRYHVSTECDLSQIVKVSTEQGKKGDLVSVRISACLPSGICSQPYYVNYVLIDEDEIPNSPTLTGLELNKEELKASAIFTPQLEKVQGTMIVLYKQGAENTKYTKVVPHIGNRSVEPIQTIIDNIGEMSFNDTWCLKAKTIGLNGKVSEWSAPLCKELMEENAVLPAKMLTWPTITNTVKQGKSYNISFNANSKKIRIELAKSTYNKEIECSALGGLNRVSNFVVYRQTIMDDGSKSKFVQISPLVERGVCEKRVYKYNDYLVMEDQGYIYFEDKYPYVLGEKYRYMILFFDGTSKELKSYSLTNPDVLVTH